VYFKAELYKELNEECFVILRNSLKQFVEELKKSKSGKKEFQIFIKHAEGEAVKVADNKDVDILLEGLQWQEYSIDSEYKLKCHGNCHGTEPSTPINAMLHEMSFHAKLDVFVCPGCHDDFTRNTTEQHNIGCNNELLEFFRSVGVVERPSGSSAINAWILKNEREFKGIPSLLEDGTTMLEMLDLISLFPLQDVTLMALKIAMAEIVKEEAEINGAKVEVFPPEFMAFYDVDEKKGKCWEEFVGDTPAEKRISQVSKIFAGK
jgi:hypothetical protein